MLGQFRSPWAPFSILLLLISCTGPGQAATIILNGGFESGFASWSVADQAGGANAGWQIQTGTTSPLNGFTVPLPPQSTHAAMTDAGGPGSHVLYQSFTVAPGSTATLSFDLFVGSGVGIFTPSSPTLDFNAIPNQQARVDILSGTATTATAFSLASVVDNVFDPSASTSSYSLYTFNITSVVGAGGTFTLRFAEVDNLANFNLGVDNVSIVTATTAVPEPSSGLMAATFAVFLVGLAARSKVAR